MATEERISSVRLQQTLAAILEASLYRYVAPNTRMMSCDGVGSQRKRCFCCRSRHPDKLRVVWIRRNRRHMTKVRLMIAEATVQHVQGSYNKRTTLILARFLHSRCAWGKTFNCVSCLCGLRQPHTWQPGITNPHRGLVLWQLPESLDITVTLFKV